MKYPAFLFTVLALYLSGCTAVNVRPIPTETRITNVLIRENPKVPVADFLDVVIEGFERHGISTKVISESADAGDAFVVTYTAQRRWDMAIYLVDATISIEKEGHRLAHAQYHLRNGGGLSVTKWSGTKTKIDPVIDKLLKDYRTTKP